MQINIEEIDQGEAKQNPLIKKFESFFKAKLKKEIELLAQKYPEKRGLLVDFNELSAFDYKLADELLANPAFVFEAAELAVQNIDVPNLGVDEFKPHVRFVNLPKEKESSPLVRDISAKHLNKLIVVEGVITQITDVLPKLMLAVWQCRRCGNTYRIIQEKRQQQTPTLCECKHRDFQLLEEQCKFVDSQRIRVQEPLELLKGGGQPTFLDIYLLDDLVNRVDAGDRVEVNGILRLLPPKDVKDTVYRRYLDANFVTQTEKEFEELEIDEEEKKEITALSKDPMIYEKLVQSLAPAIYGHEIVKEAIILQLFGGAKKTLPDGTKIRGNVHVLLIGDPGTAKSSLLQAADRIAPKSIYVAGKTSSGVGLTASAVKDEFGEGGWVLKAGALVLASGGATMVDEFDKMDPADRDAMHEALEQQCYHKSTELMFADGSTKKIGELIDELLSENKEKIIKVKDVEVLDVKGLKVLTTDFNKVFAGEAQKVSRHKAPSHFVRVSFTNGRTIVVTPEHPLFILKGMEIETIPAMNAVKGLSVPMPKHLIQEECNEIISKDVGRLLGYITTEGHSYVSEKHRYAEIGVSNTDPLIANEVKDLFKTAFNVMPCVSIRKKENCTKSTKDLFCVRISSKKIYNEFKEKFSELLTKARNKRVPNEVRKAAEVVRLAFLKAAFKGDGFIDSERFGYSTASFDLAKDYQDLLLMQGIYSYIATENRKGIKYFKTVISGNQSMKAFNELIVEENDSRKERINAFVSRSNKKGLNKDALPTEILEKVNELLKSLHLSNGKFGPYVEKKHSSEKKTVKQFLQRINDRLMEIDALMHSTNARLIRRKAGIGLMDVAKALNASPSLVTYIERKKNSRYNELLEKIKELAISKINKIKADAEKINGLIESDVKFIKIKEIELIENADSEWTYDITIEPNHAFISEGLVLHNCISVAKAGIVTRFKTETSVLAAANPNFGRFDEYENPLKQINLPPTLFSRFDLYFMIRDVLDKTKDTQIAEHILKAHQAGQLLQNNKMNKSAKLSKKQLKEIEESIMPVISHELLKKYIAFARQSCFPILSEETMKKMSDFYVALREEGKQQGGVFTATHRQLEGLVRLSEASARIRLKENIELEDVERALKLFKKSLSEVGIDPETKQFDSDLITTGRSHSQLTGLKKVLSIVKEKAKEFDSVPLDQIIEEAGKEGLDAEKVRDYVAELHKKGELYEVRHGLYKPTQKESF